MSDLISRQAAINTLHDEIVRRRISEDSNDDGALDEFDTEAILRRLPSAQPEQRWIPCSERLPETFEVLCCDIRGEICIAYPYADKNSDTGYSAESELVYMRGCLAWMPLPEPYKEDK